MSKAIVFFLCLVMLVQIIRPLGWPGLRRRADAWKLAVCAVVIVMAASVLRMSS